MHIVVFGGGGKVARLFTSLAAPNNTVYGVVRNNDHTEELKNLGASVKVLSLEEATVDEIVTLFQQTAADAVVFSAGAGGKGGAERAHAVDYLGSVKVFDACEKAGVRRILLVSAVDTRDVSKEAPSHYNDASKAMSERVWSAIGPYMKAKLASELDLQKRKDKLDFTVLRPGRLTEEMAKGVEVGITQLESTSRAAVAEVLLACLHEPGTAGLTLDVMDGSGDVKAEVEKCAREKIDAFTG